MDDQPTSGNRWERPADKPAADATTEAPVMPDTASTDPVASSSARRERRTALTRPRRQLAGAALVVLLVGGGAGFAVGSTTGDGGDDRGGFPGSFPGARHLRDDDGFGVPPGGLPGQRGQEQGQQQPFGQQDDGAGT